MTADEEKNLIQNTGPQKIKTKTLNLKIIKIKNDTFQTILACNLIIYLGLC